MNESYAHPALFTAYPSLKEKLAWVKLGEFPTPVHPLKNVGCDNLWIKRDDQTSSLYGGNKIRKLEFLLGDAVQKNCRHVITMGAIGTNHGLATAIYCDRMGLDCSLVLFDQPVTKNVKQNLLLFKKLYLAMCGINKLKKSILQFYFYIYTRRKIEFH